MGRSVILLEPVVIIVIQLLKIYIPVAASLTRLRLTTPKSSQNLQKTRYHRAKQALS